MANDLRLLMLGAMYENGGNTAHRFLDGHPQLFVYPFESQLGTRLVSDGLSALYPQRYRWPAFALDATPAEDYHAIIDEEVKVRARTPHVSKFRGVAFEFSDDERRARYLEIVGKTGRSRGDNVAAFFRATFEAWSNRRRTGEASVYVGYSPIVLVDAEKILADLPNATLLHIVRNPWSAYADTKRRPVPLSLPEYLLRWCIAQHHALLAQRLHPRRVQIIRYEDLVAAPRQTLGGVCAALGLETPSSLEHPTWNGEPLPEVYPWGTIRQATSAANRATAEELTPTERDEIQTRAWPYLDHFDYRAFLA